MSYLWTCENVTAAGGCKYFDGADLEFEPESQRLSFAAGTFWRNTAMRWTLKVSKKELIDSTYATIKIVPSLVVTVGIKTVKEGIKVNRNKLAILSATAYSQSPYNLTYSWTSDPAIPLSSFVTGTAEKYLKIAPYSLSEDLRYNFTCLVKEPDGTEGEALIRVTVNRSPRLGTFTVIPNSGSSYDTIFELKAEDWRDDDVPLSYLFSYEDPESNRTVPLGERTGKNSLSTALGIGKINCSTTVRLKLEVFDSLNASSEKYVSVVLEPAEGSSAKDLIEAVAKSGSTGSGAEKIQLLAKAGKQLDCGNQREAGMCGEMLGLLRTVELGMGTVSTETDETIISLLSSMNLSSGEYARNVVNVLDDVANREMVNVNKILSVADGQLEGKKVKYGLDSVTAIQILGILGETISEMSSAQRQEQQESIVKTADAVGRSLLKDAVPNEGAIVVNTSSVILMAQKLSSCAAKGVASNFTVNGIELTLPICDILTVNQTTFSEKTLNKISPYDLIIEVFDQNVMGDCVPLGSKLLRVVIYDDEAKSIYSARNVSSGINFTFQLADGGVAEDDLLSFSCAYYSGEQAAFTPDTMSTKLLDAGTRLFQCTTTHLSEFAMMYTIRSTSKSCLDFEFWLLLALLVLCIAMHIWAAIYDSKYRPGVVPELLYKSQKVASKLAEIRAKESEKTLNQPFKQPYKDDNPNGGSNSAQRGNDNKKIEAGHKAVPEATTVSGIKLLSLVILVKVVI